VFENRLLRKKRGKVTGEWRRLHNEELYDLYPSPGMMWVIISRRMRWAGHVRRMGDVRGAYTVSVGSHEGKRPLGRPKRRWEDNINWHPSLVKAGHGKTSQCI
jgi:hypothetical protein